MAAGGLPVEVACAVLEVSVSGFYAWQDRPPSARAIRHAWLSDLICQIHSDFRGVYGYRRVHAELTIGHGISVGHEAVELLMRRAGLQGVSGRPRRRRVPNMPTAGDLVDRPFHRDSPDQLWVTDIGRHDALPNRAVVTNALGMAIDHRNATGTVIHSDQGPIHVLGVHPPGCRLWALAVDGLDRAARPSSPTTSTPDGRRRGRARSAACLVSGTSSARSSRASGVSGCQGIPPAAQR
jgi:transposase InsO family protein